MKAGTFTRSDVSTAQPPDPLHAEENSDKVSQGEAVDSETQATEWSVAKRLAFRIAFVYFVLYALPFPFGFIPGTEALASVTSRADPSVMKTYEFSRGEGRVLVAEFVDGALVRSRTETGRQVALVEELN